jgi:SagB-type dehydrogenase family enzyme
MEYVKTSYLRREEIRHYKKPDVASVPIFKTYPLAERIPLPLDWSLEEARLSPLLQHRRSRRKFSAEPLPFEAISYMLWASQGVTASSGAHLLRTTPSAGALYPVETYVSVQNVEGLAKGIYHLDIARFELELLKPGNYGDDIAQACLNQQFLGKAGAVFIWSAMFRRNFCKYGDRGLRYIYMDVGHICQNLLLAAEANGSGACPVAAFFDEELNSILGLDGQQESALYLAGVGGL